jgi:steroid 5-alpha reductase family enzyme
MKRFIFFLLAALCLSAIITFPFVEKISELIIFLSDANALLVVTLWTIGFALASFLFGLITGDYSWVDRIWSLLPVAFVWYYAYRGGFTVPLCLVTVLVSIWGARLTYNFARKGGYTGVEDYRWIVLRRKIKTPFLWQLFNFLFIGFFQIGLFVLFTWPVYRLTDTEASAPSALTWVLTVLGLVFICFEFIADQMQWNFHKAKKSASLKQDYNSKYSDDVKNGFFSQGLFAISRHPNYFGELGFWWTVWLLTLSVTGELLTSGFFGPLALTVLFIGSTIFTESISSSKYTGYKNYQKRVSPIIPWIPRKK